MSEITYNGVTLPYARISRFDQEAVYDEVGQTDWYCIRFDIECQAVINTSYLSVISPDLYNQTNRPQNVTEIMRSIRNSLLQPRRALSVTFNGIELIPKTTYTIGTESITPAVDAANGPKPQSCKIIELTNTTFLVTFHIIANYWEKLTTENSLRNVPNSNTPVTGNAILYNRWSEGMDIDFAGMTRRTREGTFRIRSDNDGGLIADQLRVQMGVVGVPPGFLRESSHYTVNPDGLAIKYRVTDKEVYKMPPFPAYKAQGEYTESFVKMGYAKYIECRVKLWGSKGYPAPNNPTGSIDNSQTNLLRTALGVVSTKMQLSGAPIYGPTNFTVKLESLMIRVNMYENEVEVSARALKNLSSSAGGPLNTNQTDGAGGINWDNITVTPGSDIPIQGLNGTLNVSWQPQYNFFGSASRLLHTAAYFDPALRNQFINQGLGTEASTGLEPGQAGVQGEL